MIHQNSQPNNEPTEPRQLTHQTFEEWQKIPVQGVCTKPTTPSIELIIHPSNTNLVYQRNQEGEVICCYIGFRSKNIAKSWQYFIEKQLSQTELRKAKRLGGFRWEIKVVGLSLDQLHGLATHNFSKEYRGEIGGAVSLPPKKQPEPVDVSTIKPGDIVTPLFGSDDLYEFIELLPDGILNCKSLQTGIEMGIRATAVMLSVNEKTTQNEAF